MKLISALCLVCIINILWASDSTGEVDFSAQEPPAQFSIEFSSYGKKDSGFTHIAFEGKGLSETNYFYDDDSEALAMDVSDSASFVIYPFDNVISTRRVVFGWKKLSGEINNSSADIEMTANGDDFYLRVGLLLKPRGAAFWDGAAWRQLFGKGMAQLGRRKWHSTLIDTFAEKGHDLRRGIMLVPQTANAPGKVWKSFVPGLLMAAVDEVVIEENGWSYVDFHLSDLQNNENFDSWCGQFQQQGCEVVGFWIMADGDDTDSQFRSLLNVIELY